MQAVSWQKDRKRGIDLIDKIKNNAFDALKLTWPMVLAVISFSFWFGGTASTMSVRFDHVDKQIESLERDVTEIRRTLIDSRQAGT